VVVRLGMLEMGGRWKLDIFAGRPNLVSDN
jgi:hypothetical protein